MRAFLSCYAVAILPILDFQIAGPVWCTDSPVESNAKLHAALAMLPNDKSVLPFLKDRLLTVTPTQFHYVRDLLVDDMSGLIEGYWLTAMEDENPARRFQAACALAHFDPENAHWQGPQMQAFLRLASSKPDRLASALHEYSYRKDSIEVDSPYLVGRFQSLSQITDGMGIPRPTVLITEWGWTYEEVPTVDVALKHVDWANRLYAPYPQVKGAAIWYLGPGYDNIAGEAQKLIYPIMIYNLTHAYER